MSYLFVFAIILSDIFSSCGILSVPFAIYHLRIEFGVEASLYFFDFMISYNTFPERL
jgi:hypothetical protein